MQHRHLLRSLLLPLFGLAACGEQEPPTAPAEPRGPALIHTARHKVVNSLGDPGNGTCNAAQCTLREAINAPGSAEISFASGLTGSITLASPRAGGGQLVIEKSLTITGPSTGIIIRRRSTDPAFRILRIGPGATATLTNLTLRAGKETDRPGGGIINFGKLALTNCTVAGNAALHGGGIDNHGPLTLSNSTVANNSAGSGAGGIDNHNNGTLTLTQSTVTRNAGNGIRNDGSTLVLTSSTVSYNGRGIFASRGTSTLADARIVGNTGGGIALSLGSLTLTNSTVARNSAGDGGGIANFAGRFTITNTTVTNNSATGRGGGIFNTVGDPFGRQGATLTLTNSTVSGNSAASGAGIDNSDRLGGAGLTVTNSTIALNSARDGGGGIRQEDGLENPNPLRLTNSLVAKNSASTGADMLTDQSGVFASFSLIGDGTGSDITNTDGNQVGNVSPNTSPIDPLLGPLALNGGPTRTHALLLRSPAIDAASSSPCPTTDQRGVLRPQGAACDIGSYERK